MERRTLLIGAIVVVVICIVVLGFALVKSLSPMVSVAKEPSSSTSQNGIVAITIINESSLSSSNVSITTHGGSNDS